MKILVGGFRIGTPRSRRIRECLASGQRRGPTARDRSRFPAEDIVVDIDGDNVTAQGVFDDLLTDLEIEEVPGTLEAVCGAQSIR